MGVACIRTCYLPEHKCTWCLVDDYQKKEDSRARIFSLSFNENERSSLVSTFDLNSVVVCRYLELKHCTYLSWSQSVTKKAAFLFTGTFDPNITMISFLDSLLNKMGVTSSSELPEKCCFDSRTMHRTSKIQCYKHIHISMYLRLCYKLSMRYSVKNLSVFKLPNTNLHTQLLFTEFLIEKRKKAVDPPGIVITCYKLICCSRRVVLPVLT